MSDDELTDYSELERKNRPITRSIITTVFVVIVALGLGLGVVVLNVFKWIMGD